MVEERGGDLNHGIRAEIARELGLSWSTASRDIVASILTSREKTDHKHRTSPPLEYFQWIMEFGCSLAVVDCDCEGSRGEPRHEFGHVLKFAAEALDLIDEGELPEATPEDLARLKRLRDFLVTVL
jgi:hypothetical protein